MRKFILPFVLVLSLVFPQQVDAAYGWRNNHFSFRAENRMIVLLERKHNQACSNKLIRWQNLNNIARWRARDLVRRDYFSHTIKGTNKRVWDYFPRYNIKWSFAGEILAWDSETDAKAVDFAYNLFLNSPSHLAVIVNCRFTRLGVGAYRRGTKHLFAIVYTRRP
jgi:uncharacterized protein YkwD